MTTPEAAPGVLEAITSTAEDWRRRYREALDRLPCHSCHQRRMCVLYGCAQLLLGHDV